MNLELWVQDAMKRMNQAVYTNHGSYHGFGISYTHCALGTCGNLNPMIRQAQEAGFKVEGVPSRMGLAPREGPDGEWL